MKKPPRPPPRGKAHRYLNEIDLSELCCARHVDLLRAEKSIGTLGGGNHFIEVDKDDEGNLYIVVHSGSRHLGVEVASYYIRRRATRCSTAPTMPLSRPWWPR